MTTNSINYNKHLEDKRTNLAKETETNRSNLANEAEIKRHNLETEEIARQQLEELKRHQQVTEGQVYDQLANALTVASIGAQGRVTSANISAAASRYASDNAFAANMAGVKQRDVASQRSYDSSIYSTDISSQTTRDVTSTNNAWNAYNVGRQLQSQAADREQRERSNIRDNQTKVGTEAMRDLTQFGTSFLRIGAAAAAGG